MKQPLLSALTAFFLISLFSLNVSAQELWTPSEQTGFGNTYNHTAHAMHVFKGNIYAGVGDDTGILYSSATGNSSSWDTTFSAPFVTSIDALASTAEGAGFMYLSAYAYGGDLPKVYRSVDGVAWMPYYFAQDRVTHIVPFKGTGTVDSIYVFERGTYGTVIKRSAYNNNDPGDTLSSWNKVLDFGLIMPYTEVRSQVVHNGKLYIGTNNAEIWSTADGINWSQNTFVGNGFGNTNNAEITALGSFGGYLYAGTYNYSEGTQIWRSDNDTAWTLVAQYNGYEKTTDFKTAGGKLWLCMAVSGGSGSGQILNSSDGIVFYLSSNDGFGKVSNYGRYGNMCVFGNNMYYACENYGSGLLTTYPGDPARPVDPERGGGTSTGAEIWRTCLMTPPTISIGADQVVCQGTAASFNASPGFVSYLWEDGSASQLLSTIFAGEHFVIATDANGCDALDTAKLSTLPVPDVNITNPAPFSTVCQGTSVTVTGNVVSNVHLPQPPFNKITADSISYSLGNTYDTIAVTGIPECSCTALYSVTIDSLYHAYDGDVSLALYSPSGAFINLLSGAYGTNFIGTELVMNGAGPAGNMGTAPFTGQFTPNDPFSNLTGSANGNWILQMNDNYITDDGILKGWTLKFTLADSVLTYSWNPTTGVSISTSLNTTITPPVTANYVLTTTNSVGCTDKDTLSMFIPAITMAATDDSICYGSGTVLSTDGSISASWTPGGSLSSSTGTSVIATPSTSTMYYVSDLISGCAATDSILVTVDAPITVNPGNSKTICFSDSTSVYGAPSGGTAPLTYLWSGGSTSSTNLYFPISPAVTTTYNLFVTDGFGCIKSDSLTISVAPSTDIYGHVGFSGGNVTGSSVVLFKYYPFLTQFDTLQTTTTDGSGNYHFSAVNHEDCILEIFPSAAYTTLIPTYFGNVFLWDSADVIYHYCATNDTLNIAMVEEAAASTGPGHLHGSIVEDTGFGRVPGDPIPGVDVKLGRNPGDALVTCTQTDTAGEYSFSYVAYGNYTVYADIPGLGRDSSYTFTVDSVNSVYNYLNYIVDSTTIYIVPDAGVGVHNIAANEVKFSVYPNPSKGDAVVEYVLNTDSEISLGIYNVLGVKVSELVNTHQQAGTYTYAINEKNKALHSGVYFVTLIANGKTSIHKIIVTE